MKSTFEQLNAKDIRMKMNKNARCNDKLFNLNTII